MTDNSNIPGLIELPCAYHPYVVTGYLGDPLFTGVIRVYDGDIAYFKDGKRHREDGPAVIHADGSQFWFQNGYSHREDGPAREYTDGRKEWWLGGSRLDFEYWLVAINADEVTKTYYRVVYG